MNAWLIDSLWLLPLVTGILLRRARKPSSARAVATTVATLLFALSLVLLFGRGIDGLSAILVSLVSGLIVVLLVGVPRVELDVETVADVLLVEGGALGVLVSTNVLVLALCWALTTIPLRLEASRSRDVALGRAFLWLSTFSVTPLFAVALALSILGVQQHLASPFDLTTHLKLHLSPRLELVLGSGVVLAATARSGVFPFHLWVPAALERGRISSVLPTVVSPLGSFIATRLGLSLFPRALTQIAPLVIAMGTASALYGAVVALGRHNARRQLAFLWVSIVGFVFVGLASLDVRAMSGSMFYDVAAALSMTGLLLIVRAVEARTGTADMRCLGGLVRFTPRLAACYFLLGVATVCFPGTASFVCEDLLVQGLHERHPVVVVLLLIATALNGVSLVRSFKRLFLGTPSMHAPPLERVEDMLPRERWVAVVLITLSLLGGFLPSPLLRIRHSVVDSLRIAMPVEDGW